MRSTRRFRLGPIVGDFSPALPDETKVLPAGNQTEEASGEDDAGTTKYDCFYTEYSVTQTPEKIVMFGNPDRELLWPGALVQGKSLRDGTGIGSIGALVIDQRTPLTVRIPTLMNDDNMRTVEHPTGANVEQAIGSMIGAATLDQLSTPSNISYVKSEVSSSEQFALGASLSARYLGFKLSASAGVNRNANTHTVVAHFYETMFDVMVEPPQTPAGWFSPDFVGGNYEQQVALGRIGRDNLPVYVSKVIYGRMLIFSVTSSESVQSIEAALNASYSGVVNVSGSIETKYQNTLKNSEIKFTTIGGKSTLTLDAIRAGNLTEYFNDASPLSSAAPIGYIFRNIGDNSIAKVSETTKYKVKQCTPQDDLNPPIEQAIAKCDAARTLLDRATNVTHAYFNCPDKMNWVAAREFCRQNKSHLVTITSSDENTFVQSVNSKTAFWTAGYVPSAQCNGATMNKSMFVWDATAEPMSVTFFASGEPNYSSECCLEVYNASGSPVGQWNNLPCNQEIPFICEREAEPGAQN